LDCLRGQDPGFPEPVPLDGQFGDYLHPVVFPLTVLRMKFDNLCHGSVLPRFHDEDSRRRIVNVLGSDYRLQGYFPEVERQAGFPFIWLPVPGIRDLAGKIKIQDGCVAGFCFPCKHEKNIPEAALNIMVSGKPFRDFDVFLPGCLG